MAAESMSSEQIMRAVKNHGTRLMVNWPFAWWPQLQKAMAMAKAGDIGRIWQVKYRAAHQGPRELGCSDYFCSWLYDDQLNGGGASIDYACYGCALSCALLGKPRSVSASIGRFCKEDVFVDDNAVVMMRYSHAICLSEASWTQVGNLTSYVAVIYGEKGTLLVEPGDDGRLLLATEAEPDATPVTILQSPPHMRSASAHFLHALSEDEPFMELVSAEIGHDTQQVLEAAIESSKVGINIDL